jgi:NADP-dependent 3-hydroxy acid dehydrogenase YdfG
MRVAVLARRRDRLEELAGRLRSDGAEVLVHVGDLRVADDVLSCFESIRRSWGGLDLLVNNAGTARMGPLAEGSFGDWTDTLTVNVAGPALCAREALVDMAERDEGQIVNIASIYGHKEQVPNFAFYQASKFALRALTNTLRAELAAAGRDNVRVGMISPGMVATEFRVQATDGAQSYESYFENFQPLLPSDIVDAVVYMLSPAPHVQVQDIILSPMGQRL